MEDILWYLLASSRGGTSRARILRALADRPKNANQISEELDLDYTTVRHHLDVLMENSVVKKIGDGYGDVYVYTEQVKHDRETLQEILETVDPQES